jgi:hypothetical protein
MRRLIALAVLVTAATIFANFSSSARAEGSATASVQSKGWITLHSAPVAAQADHRSWSRPNQEPVLLPLPAEGWVGMVMLLSIVIYCGVRRARFLAIR